jgi:nucleoside-diphosphate-sugar epimerase
VSLGVDQLRPNIHIEDMIDTYLVVLDAPKEKISGEVFNVGTENKSVLELAQTVKSIIGEDVKLILTPTNDNRSYHISSQKIADKLGFIPSHTIADAILDIKIALERGLLPNSLTDERYFNIKRMQNIDLQ